MKETLEVENGAGLAAPQVGVLRQIAVIQHEDEYYEIINPKIISSAGEVIMEEGCLSVPEVWGPVKRPETITVAYMDREGQRQEKEISGMLARIFCHEIDHLHGVLFVDKMIKEEE